MTPPRSGSRNGLGYLVPIGHAGELRPLSDLPIIIAELEALSRPLVVEVEPNLPEHAQRLFAELGVTVRFRPVTPSRRSKRSSERRP